MNAPGVATRILVQKFGGSSVAHEEGRACLVAKVKQALAHGATPVVVVSAMGRRGDPYATDTLISQVDFVPRDLRDARELDMLMACGEIISVVVCAHALREAGIPAAGVVGGDIGMNTDGAFGEAHIMRIDPTPILDVVRSNRVPVVAGFQGTGPDGHIVTLGRGGSDTTAVALGVALGAEAVEIYSDVAGVMTTDPRIYSQAQLVPQLSCEELGELAVEGAKVMHPRSVDLASAHGTPLRIRSTFTDHPGTTVHRDPPTDALERQRVVTSITPLMPVSHVIVSLPSVSQQAKDRALAHLFEKLTGIGISLDLINICPETLYFIVKQEFVEKVVDALEQLWLSHTVRRDCAKISLVGVGMRGTPGVVGRIHKALQRADIGILHSTDSNITVSCLVDGADMPRAVEALHHEFMGTAPSPS